MNIFNPPEPKVLSNFINSVKQKLYNKPIIFTNLEYPVLFVGDIHGYYDNIMNAFKVAKENEVKTIVFLGDYVDRGPESLQLKSFLNVIYYFAHSNGLKKKYSFIDDFFQDDNNNNTNNNTNDNTNNNNDKYNINYDEINVVALRGNHEDKEICSQHGFTEELNKIYPNNPEIIEDILSLFIYLPIGAVTSKGTLGLHGGIPKIEEKYDATFLDVFNCLKLPFPRNEVERRSTELMNILFQITWNDPNTEITYDKPVFSDNFRGSDSYRFNHPALSNFLIENEFRRLVRSHESIRGAYEKIWGGELIHIFSAFPYFNNIKTSTYFLEFSDGSGKIIDHNNKTLDELRPIE